MSKIYPYYYIKTLGYFIVICLFVIQVKGQTLAIQTQPTTIDESVKNFDFKISDTAVLTKEQRRDSIAFYRKIARPHAEKYYKQYKSSAVAGFFSGVACCVLPGVAGPLLMHFSRPAHVDLPVHLNQYKMNELYYAAYVKEARRIKRREVWRYYAIGIVVQASLVLFIFSLNLSN